MFTHAEVAKLSAIHTVEPMVLSVYLNVPPRPAELGRLPARASELIAAAERAAGRTGRLREEDRYSVREQLAAVGRDWPGRTAAIFACADVGLLEAFPLPGRLPERAVLGTRPHVRPLLFALEHCPAPDRVRELAAPVIARWTGEQAQRLAGEILAIHSGGLSAIGLTACLAAVNAGAVEKLTVPGDGLVAGYECGRCGALGIDADSCPDWGTAALRVPDLIEEMVSRVLEDGGEISVICDGSSPIAARLYFPVARQQ